VTQGEYRVYAGGELVRVAVIEKPQRYFKSTLRLDFIAFSYPILCRSFRV